MSSLACPDRLPDLAVYPDISQRFIPPALRTLAQRIHRRSAPANVLGFSSRAGWLERASEACCVPPLPTRSGLPKRLRRRGARARDARNNEHHACARRRVGEVAGIARSSVRAMLRTEQVPQPSGAEAYGGPTRLWPRAEARQPGNPPFVSRAPPAAEERGTDTTRPSRASGSNDRRAEGCQSPPHC